MKKRILTILAGLLFLVPATGIAMEKSESETQQEENSFNLGSIALFFTNSLINPQDNNDNNIDFNIVLAREILPKIFSKIGIDPKYINIEISIELIKVLHSLYSLYQDPYQDKNALKSTLKNALIKILNIKKISKDFNLDQKNLEQVLEFLLEQSLLPTQPKESKIKQFLKKFIPHKLFFNPQLTNQLKYIILGAGGTVGLWLLGHGLCHPCMEFFEPQSFLTAIPGALSLGFVVYKVIKELTKVNTYQDLALNTIKSIVDYILSKFISQENKDYVDHSSQKNLLKKSKPKNDLYSEFVTTLTNEQRNLLPQNILNLSRFEPTLLLKYYEFLSSLDQTQNYVLLQLLGQKQ